MDTCTGNSSLKSRCFVRAGLQTRSRFTIRGILSGKPVRRVKLETVGRVVNPRRMVYREGVWRPACTVACWILTPDF